VSVLGNPAARRPDLVSILALGFLIATLLQSFQVYPSGGSVLIFGVAFGGAHIVHLLFRPARIGLRRVALLAGALSCLFALFGPADGLF
jgi:hypothetical protein